MPSWVVNTCTGSLVRKFVQTVITFQPVINEEGVGKGTLVLRNTRNLSGPCAFLKHVSCRLGG